MSHKTPSTKYLLLAWALIMGCFSCTQTASDNTDEKHSKDDHMVETKNKAPKSMEKSDLTGKWIYDEAPDEPMTVQKTGNNMKIEWVAVIDRDIEVKGELSPDEQGGFSGNVSYYIGDEKGEAPAAIHPGNGEGQMDFTFETLFDGPVPFSRLKALSCEEAALKALERSNAYQQLAAGNEVEGIIAEPAEGGNGFDLQVYALSDSEEMLTLGRFMVDVKGQAFQQYDVVEGSFSPVDEGGLFDGIDCQ